MKEKFLGFLGYEEKEYKELWDKAIFVVDTNVLLNFYKYTTKDTYKSFFDILKDLKVKNRLFIPHQVALEYFHNYERNMDKQAEGFKKLADRLLKLKKDAELAFKSIESDYPYILNDNFKFILDDLEESNKKLKVQLEQEIKSLPDVKEIQSNLLELLDGLIGEAYNQEKINEIEKEGVERYKHDVPPGWEDRDDTKKQKFRQYGNVRYQQLYGDLIMWNQMIDKSKGEDNPVPMIFITEEKKEDWWEKNGSQIKRPQPHLIQEFFEKTKQKFYMYRIDSFMKFAKEYLDANVTDEQIENVTREVETIRKVEEHKENSIKKISKNSVRNAFQYLTKEEKERFDQMLKESYDLDLDSSTANFKYNQAMEWALRLSLTRMENQFLEMITRMSGHNHGDAHTAHGIYENLPDDLEQRMLHILKGIKYLDDRIAFYEVQGY
ncbi:PIN-like domain-containing protein [Cytobacillus pseudoceanisediminis]|uniref:PIN like domain-containing protein n=1 Tax=Cytobacillus oceanisediminis TaxID=665099 RepID=A0ABX3CXY1_9BACI|nr:PIN-like domain-containing protein [Cytobacillus oceanisediminis]OHX49944.1 hypothetical protein BBV17_10640 [Cytobacillus oceanisediminis]